MRNTLLLMSLVSVGTNGVGLFGFIEVRWRGREVMFAGHPIDPFFLEAGSLFLILSGLTMVPVLFWHLLGHLKRAALQDLDELQGCGEALTDWASRRQPKGPPEPRARTRLRYLKLMEKYGGWLAGSPETPSVANNVLLAAGCAETIRAYGYVRGRFMIWCERRRTCC